jgi:hypothetical protein
VLCVLVFKFSSIVFLQQRSPSQEAPLSEECIASIFVSVISISQVVWILFMFFHFLHFIYDLCLQHTGRLMHINY